MSYALTVSGGVPPPIVRAGLQELTLEEIESISGGVTVHGACMAAAAATGFVLGAGAVVAVSMTPQGEAIWGAAMTQAVAGNPSALTTLASLAGGIIVGTTSAGAALGTWLCPAEPDPSPPPHS